MRLPLVWLREYITTDADANAIAALLTARGFAVDAIERQPTPDRIVVGAIEKLERHPNADRLAVSTVDVGSERLQIVTGATNVSVGQRIPIALVGAEVFEHGSADGAAGTTHVIRSSALRGVESNGMMCSSTELALPGEFEDGILILDDDTPIGTDFWKAVRFGDAVLDVDVPSNRPDGLSIIGLAREVAAGLRVAWREPDFPENAGAAEQPINIEIADPQVCRRFVGQAFSRVPHRRAPMWMTLRLHAAGVRSLDLLVDISNYAMLETGQPLHFYDAARIRGKTLVARGAHASETVVTLDGTKRELPAGTPVIADTHGVVGVAGVFGGQASAVTDATTEIFVEAANFAGALVRRGAMALGLRTEASARHEKNLPLELPDIGRRAAAKLLVRAGAVPSRVVDVGERFEPPHKISVRHARVNRVLGTAYTSAEMAAALTPLGFSVAPDRSELRSGTTDHVERVTAERMTVTPPFWRGDVLEEIDVVEEIARATGYDAIPAAEMTASPQDIDEGIFDQETLLARRAASLGYHEIVTLSLQGSRVVGAWERSGIPFWSKPVTIVNPLSDEQRFLRPSLLPGLLETASRWHAATHDGVRLFEIGHVFRSVDAEPEHAHEPHVPLPLPPSGAYESAGVLEWPSLCALVAFADSDVSAGASSIDRRLLEVKGEVEALAATVCPTVPLSRAQARAYFHPGGAGALEIEGRPVAKFGRLHPRLARAYELPESSYAFMLHLEDLPKERPVISYRPLPRFPGTQRDIAVVVDEAVSAGDLMEAIRAAGAPAFEDVEAFDEYRGPQVPSGRKSIALRISLRKPETTITDAEAEASMNVLLAALVQRFGATLRS
jgi:phenylalanyl-tRNA synthetase beta chain